MSADEENAAINYYCQKKLINHVFMVCESGLKKKPGDPVLLFWRAFAMIKQGGGSRKDGSPTEALRELQGIQEKRDLVLACPTAMVYAHERCKFVDHEAIQELEAKLTIASSSTSLSERALVQVALFQLHTGHVDSARGYLKKAMESAGPGGGAGGAATAMGWVEMGSGKDVIVAKAAGWFERVLERSPRDLEALMGRLMHLRRQPLQSTPSLDIATQIIVHHPHFVPAHVERMAILLETASWDQLLEAAQRLAAMNPDGIHAGRMLALIELSREGGFKMAITHLGTLNQLIEKAIALDPQNSSYKTELGYIHLLMGNITRARESYLAAVQLDAHNVHAVEGVIRCQLYNGQFDNAEEQLEMFKEIQRAMGKTAEISYLISMLSWYKYADTSKRLRYLREAVEIQLALVNANTLSYEYYVIANPDFLLEIVKDYMEHCPSEAKRDGEEVHPVVRIVQDLLEVICRIVPGSTEATFYLAKIRFLMGDKMAAQVAATSCLRLDSSYSKAHILMAQIHLSNNHHKQAMQSLEMGLSYNFEVRNVPLFHILKARALRLQGSLDEALATLNAALNLPGMKEPVKGGCSLWEGCRV
ncbi:hypothetical protein BDK51DRAFT_26131 [Blyttiomyces helicus]|uniref:Uncharacterized protein n=1 Tax=Blyttiomyces helicus TaxID=388810 RepID=A0A4P9WAJ0_9FUNG|nr:hypothetical protein BDK51DRAFT_26131 [Blyttiomyces helicus]|eukprot:RKO88575.1 hypothetical protein BDK51DRAFT_26131 [Blyttiomyces helicus]